MMAMLNNQFLKHVFGPMGSTQIRWVDDSFITLVGKKGEKYSPMQALIVDMATYSWGVNNIEVPADKVQYFAPDGESIYLPTKEKLKARVGRRWADETEEQREELLVGATEIKSKEIHNLLGCTIVYGKGAREPEGLEIGRAHV